MENKQEFLNELTALTKKYKISIDGCGCCGSPALNSIEIVSEDSKYVLGRNKSYQGEDNLLFLQPGDTYWDWYHEDEE